jgi:hypothetical protein
VALGVDVAGLGVGVAGSGVGLGEGAAVSGAGDEQAAKHQTMQTSRSGLTNTQSS